MFPLIYVWINDWVNNLEVGDLRRHRGHYNVTLVACNHCFLSHVHFASLARVRCLLLSIDIWCGNVISCFADNGRVDRFPLGNLSRGEGIGRCVIKPEWLKRREEFVKNRTWYAHQQIQQRKKTKKLHSREYIYILNIGHVLYVKSLKQTN